MARRKTINLERVRATYRKIRDGVIRDDLLDTFTPREVNELLKIDWAGTSLPKHRKGNLRGETELFIRISSRPALYSLAESIIRTKTA